MALGVEECLIQEAWIRALDQEQSRAGKGVKRESPGVGVGAEDGKAQELREGRNQLQLPGSRGVVPTAELCSWATSPLETSGPPWVLPYLS